MFHNDILPTSEQLNTCLMCTAVILQNQQLSAVIGQKDHVSWVASIVSSIYQVFLSCKYLLVLFSDNKDKCNVHVDVENWAKMCTWVLILQSLFTRTKLLTSNVQVWVFFVLYTRLVLEFN